MSDTAATGSEFDGYDLFEGAYAKDPHAVWRGMRASGCPVAHSNAWGGSWLPVSYEDVRAITRDPQRFSSRAVEVGGELAQPGRGLMIPPVTSDPPEHKSHRDVLMPFFMPARIDAQEPFVRALTRDLVAGLVERGGGDAVDDFAQQLPMAVLAEILGVHRDNRPRFIDWTVRMLRIGPTDQAVREAVIQEVMAFLDEELERRLGQPSDDLIGSVARAEMDGQPLTRRHQLGTLFLVVMAGADTTWSAIGAALWHLGTHHQDRDRLVTEPDLIPVAMEELLRVYAPVTMARVTTEDVELCGREIGAQQRVLMPFPAANRDPAVFDSPNDVVLDRRRNRHLAFGSGIHRCIGSGLARLELKVTLEEWLKAMPAYEVRDPERVTWTPGSVRGPEHVPFSCASQS